MRRPFLRALLIPAVLLGCVFAALPFVLPPIVRHVVATRLLAVGVPADVSFGIGYGWTATGPGVKGTLGLSLVNTPWRVQAVFGASAFRWNVEVRLPETRFSEGDGAVRALLLKRLPTSVSNVVVSGSVSADARVDRTWSDPVPVWKGRLKLRDIAVSAVSDEMPVRAEGFELAFAASGIGRHADLSPIRLRAQRLAYATMRLEDVRTSVHLLERAFFVNEATAAFCGGRASLYSLFLDPKTLNAGFTLFLEDVDAGQALSSFPSVRGTATGRLHGKLRLFARDGGRALRLQDVFLYSVPGETGKLKLEEASAVTSNLALAGMASDQCENVSRALTDLDYRVLRIEMRQGREADATLNVRIEGTATRGETTVPVNLNVTFRGDIEQLVNTGLQLTGKGKETLK